MPKDNVVDFKKPETFIDDPITDVLRTEAKKLLTGALEAEPATFYLVTLHHSLTKSSNII